MLNLTDVHQTTQTELTCAYEKMLHVAMRACNYCDFSAPFSSTGMSSAPVAWSVFVAFV
jgi:hypothetical protein